MVFLWRFAKPMVKKNGSKNEIKLLLGRGGREDIFKWSLPFIILSCMKSPPQNLQSALCDLNL